mgnify:CR=1 FL=1
MPAMFKMESGETWYMGADATNGDPFLRFDTPKEDKITVWTLHASGKG